MSKIKVYVRVRPSLPGEFDAPGTFNCTELEDVSGNWIQIKKDGEARRYFARVWGPMSTQEEVFRTVGVNTVNDVFEGYYGCIFVYGQTGTGKTFTLGCLAPGLEGVQPQCLQFIFSKAAKEASKFEVTIRQSYVQLYRDNVQDLLDITKDDLVVRVDDVNGATIENVTVREMTSYQEAIALIQEGDNNRVVANTKMNSASSRSHACLITEVTRKDRATGAVTTGKLYLIDLAGSERVSKSGVTGDAYKEAVAINKSLTTLGNCISGLVNGEKVVAFRDSKLTRILQHSLTGHGRTSIIVTIRPDSPNVQETLCTLKFGERAQKVETQMTPAAYREQMLELEVKLMQQELSMAECETSAIVHKSYCDNLKVNIMAKESELRELEMKTRIEVDNLNMILASEKSTLESTHKDNEAAIRSKFGSELESLKAANASVLKEIEDKVAEAASKTRAKLAQSAAASVAQLEALKKELKALAEEVENSTVPVSEDGKIDVSDKIREAEKNLEDARQKLRGCKPSKNSELSAMDIEEKLQSLEPQIQKLEARRAKLGTQYIKWNIETMKKKFETPAADAITQFIATVNAEPEAKEESESGSGSGSDSDDDSSAPPSDEPPPSSDDSDSSDSSDSDSSDSDSDSSAASDTADAKQVSLNLENTVQDTKQPGSKGKVERKQFDSALQKDAHLSELLEQILEYLEWGCIGHIVQTEPTCAIIKKHLFLSKGRKGIMTCDYGSDGMPDKKNAVEIMSVSEITQLQLGQFSEGFNKALEGAPMVPQGTPMPPTSAKISLKSLPIFFYRSMNVRAKKVPPFDFVLDTDTDFEAWIVSLHRLTLKDPQWGGPLDISTAKDAAKLSEDEKRLCCESHILPTTFLATKNNILNGEPKLFYTLFDIRTISSLDLLHSQKLFEFLCKQQYFERYYVFHIRYKELLAEEDAERKRREEIRTLRIRIVNMLRKYKPSPPEVVQEFLKGNQGREKETLEALVAQLGPEPTAEEMASWAASDGNAPQKISLEDSAPTTPGQQPATPTQPEQ